MDGLTAIAVLAILGGAVAAVWKDHAYKEMFRAVAQEHNAQFELGGFFSDPIGRILMQSGDVVLHVTAQKRGREMWLHIDAPWVSGGGPHFKIRPESVIDVRKALGARDIVLGKHRAFDQGFLINSDDPPLMRTLFPEELRDRIVTQAPAVSITGTAQGITVEHILTLDRERFSRLLVIARDLADCSAHSLRRYKFMRGAEYTGATGLPGERSLPCVTFEAEGPRVDVQPRWQGRRFQVCATMRGVPRALELRVVVRQDGSCEGDTGLIPEQHRIKLAGLGPLNLIAAAGVATVNWTELPEPDVLLSGVALLRELAHGPLQAGPPR